MTSHCLFHVVCAKATSPHKRKSSAEPDFDISSAPAPLMVHPQGGLPIRSPFLVYDRLHAKSWVMLYSFADSACELGLSVSRDGGVSWQFYGTAILPIDAVSEKHANLRVDAPFLIWWGDRTKDPSRNMDGGLHGWHLFVTLWEEHQQQASRIAHFFSRQIDPLAVDFEFRGVVTEAGPRASDPCVVRLHRGLFRLLFTDRRRTKGETSALTSPDLVHWKPSRDATRYSPFHLFPG